jgi:glycosyltransferase involved in cell wall biosynthesis
VDLSNLVVGGGVQVGASFLDELGRLQEDLDARRRWPWLATLVVEASDAVVANVTDPRPGLAVRVVDGRPASRLRRVSRRRPYDVSFTVFGPDYGSRRARTNVIGFADVTSLFPEFAEIPGRGARLRHAVRSRVSKQRFRSADLVVVESAHVAAALTSRWSVPAERITVVPNVLNRVFDDETRQVPLRVELPGGPAAPLVAFPTRPYPHKNLGVLGAAARALEDEHGRQVRFALTLTDAEWERLDSATKSASINVGPLVVGQMPALYAACDAVVFPSLNECFSVTPLEALRTGRPLVASDRAFVREVAGDAAWYFEPTEPDSVARALSGMLSDEASRERRVELGQGIAGGWPTAVDRAVAYLDLIDRALGHGTPPAR